jgi:predicted  nucleic acid-binding Zn-ribbon protein
MADTQSPPVLPTLIELSKIDTLIFGIEVQRKKILDEVATRKQALAAQEGKRAVRVKLLEEKRAACSKEEKAVKNERDRVNERRRSIGTLNNYKVQQAAEREIDFVAKQIGKREEMVLAMMRDVEILEKDVAEFDTVVSGLQGEVSALEKDATEALADFEQRLNEYKPQRAELAKSIASNPALTVYSRIQARFPQNPVAEVMNRDTCSGCHIKLGPQAVVQIARGDVVKCPGCGRILSLPAEAPQ